MEAFLKNGTFLQLDKTTLLIGFGEKIYADSKAFDSQKAVFYFPDFFINNEAKAVFNHQHSRIIDASKLLEFVSPYAKPSIGEKVWKIEGGAQFQKAVDDINEPSSSLKKVVPYVFKKTTGQMNFETIAYFLRSLIEESKSFSLTTYGSWDSENGMMGATPELLFTIEREKKEIATAALAGTLDLNRVEIDDKILREHELVVCGIEEDLKSFGKVTIGSRGETSFSNLKHIHTPISIVCEKEPSFWEVIKALHPTPALGAYPKQIGKKWLQDYDRALPRICFGAPIGFSLPQIKKSSCFAAIRGVQWKGDEIKIGAGCGVVKSSLWDDEWKEINLKLTMIKKLLRI